MATTPMEVRESSIGTFPIRLIAAGIFVGSLVLFTPAYAFNYGVGLYGVGLDNVGQTAAPFSIPASSTNDGGSGGGGRGHGRGSELSPSLSSRTSSSSSMSSSSPSVADSPHFSDVPASSWFFQYVTILSKAGVISGYKDAEGVPTGQFGPANPVTQAEILKMALLSAGKPIGEGVPQNASAQNDWSAPYVKAAETLHLSVYGPSLDIHESATRGQVIQTILEAFGVTIATGDNPFRDLSSHSTFAPAIETAYRLGIITGDTDAQGHTVGTVRPRDPINRAEAAKIIVLALQMMKE